MTTSDLAPPKVLDATFRDGGFYTDWYFPRRVVQQTVKALFGAGVDWVELGYRAPATQGAHGLYKYCTEHYLDFLPEPGATRYAFMLDQKDYVRDNKIDLDLLNSSISSSPDSIFSMCRVACHARDITFVEATTEFLRKRDFIVCVNLMGSSLLPDSEFQKCLEVVKKAEPDVFYFADSFGSMTPEQVTEMIGKIRQVYDGPLGIHTHDNQGLAFANTLQAVKDGVEYVDATLTGMGRGPGNLQLEQFMLWLANTFPDNDYEPNELLGVIENYFQEKKLEFGWGFNYVYMLSGLKNIHPTYTQRLSEGNKFGFKNISHMLEQIPAESRQSYDGKALADVMSVSTEVKSDAVELPRFEGVSTENGKCLIVARGAGEPHKVLEANRSGTSELACVVQDYLQQSDIQVFECNQTFVLEDQPRKVMCVLNQMRLQEIYARQLSPDFSIVTAQSRFSPQTGKPDLFQYPCSLGPINVSEESIRIPHYEAGQYAIALAVGLGFREILLAGFEGYVNDDQNSKMNDFFEQLGRQVPDLSLIFVTPTHYQGVVKRSLYTY